MLRLRFVVLIVILLQCGVTNAGETNLIVRGDDFGMTEGSLVAFERAFKQGILTCASLQVPAPWFEAAADLAQKNPRWCVGVHLTLIGEWSGYRWRPVQPWGKVKSIVDDDGFFLQYPEELWEKKPRIEEMELELRAQILLAIKKGVNPQYIDIHYVDYTKYPGFEMILRKLSQEFGLPVSGWMGERRLRSVYTVPLGQKKEVAIKILEQLAPGLWVWIFHPGIDSPEERALVHVKREDFTGVGGVGLHRAEETGVLTSPEIKSLIAKKGIRLTSYRELRIKAKGER
jgi:predicted glycoside hydrolase/deacetylase ChbG (UPF0249 family)